MPATTTYKTVKARVKDSQINPPHRADSTGGKTPRFSWLTPRKDGAKRGQLGYQVARGKIDGGMPAILSRQMTAGKDRQIATFGWLFALGQRKFFVAHSNATGNIAAIPLLPKGY